ncbi:MAG TPA: RNA-directed DNA polymerase [Actinomycetota bacterium]|nr:RNA-directed DNA polymerase [Actinomycetota bacterium]
MLDRVPGGRSTDRRGDLVVLDDGTSARFVSAVVPLVPHVERHLRPGVVANRVVSTANGVIRLEPWRTARARLRRELRALGERAESLLVADVRACYPSIRPEVVARCLRALGCSRRHASGLERVLEAIERSGVRGLPVGPDPSAVLANAVLAAADEALVRAGAIHLRWVDDFFVFAQRRGEGRRALAVLEATLEQLGLELAPHKTRLLEGRTEIARGLGRRGVSPIGHGYDRADDAHAVPRIPRPHALVSADG